jgi:hypothetical protein
MTLLASMVCKAQRSLPLRVPFVLQLKHFRWVRVVISTAVPVVFEIPVAAAVPGTRRSES